MRPMILEAPLSLTVSEPRGEVLAMTTSVPIDAGQAWYGRNNPVTLDLLCSDESKGHP